MKKIAVMALAVLLAVVGDATLIDAKILVVSPHPDDDLIIAAGVTYRARQRGEPVRIVYVTNGDYQGLSVGYVRQMEAVNGQVVHLGMLEDDLIFLGYPDFYLQNIYVNYVEQNDQFITPYGQSVTYGNRGLGRLDYHSHRFGSPAKFNKYNILVDLEDIILAYKPDHIFTVSEYDEHPDHKTTYQLLKDVLVAIQGIDPNYQPTVHKTIVHFAQDGPWPNPLDPTTYFSPIPDLSHTELVWAIRESLDVPLSMQSRSYSSNEKYRALGEHVSQGGTTGYLGRFVHKDEIFWVENLSGVNQPPVVNGGTDLVVWQGSEVCLNGTGALDPDGDALAFRWVQSSGIPVQLSDPNAPKPSFTALTGLIGNEVLTFELIVSDGELSSVPDGVTVTVSAGNPGYHNIAPLAAVSASSETPEYGQLAVKAVDGVIDGYPGEYMREWVTRGEGIGAWISLRWDSAYAVDRVVIYDRPNLNDFIQGATLSFNDGSSIQVLPLNNDGRGVEYTFPSKVINELRLTVNAVGSETRNIGLAEIEVFGIINQTGNNPPIANAGLDQTVLEGGIVYLDGTGSVDPDGNGLTFKWVQKGGIPVPISDSTVSTPSFLAPTGLIGNEVLTFELIVSDGELSSVPDGVKVTVSTGNPGYHNIAPLAAVSASSETPEYGQFAVKAVDGVIDGYPGEYMREWATRGEGIGAWISLRWDSAYAVDRVVIYDRPNLNDFIQGATLSFNDGSSIQVLPLNNDGRGVEYTFPSKVINELRLTVNAVGSETRNIGLAEIEVFGVISQTGNNPPIANAGLDQTVLEGGIVYLDGTGSVDPDGNGLTFKWVQKGGIPVPISDSTVSTPSFLAPTGLIGNEVLTFELIVSDGELSSVPDGVTVTVSAGNPGYHNIAPLAAVSASSETPEYGQLAVKAVDGVIDGYPGEYMREWVTRGEGIGAWISLRWDSAYAVDRVVIYDRPNLNDFIQGATLSFSDGSSIQVLPLNNDGRGVEYTFPSKVINELRLTVNAVGSETRNVGLAEIEVFGSNP